MAWRYVALPRGVAPERKAWLEAAFNAAINDPGIEPEYATTGGIMETKRLNNAQAVTAEVEKLANLERDFPDQDGPAEAVEHDGLAFRMEAWHSMRHAVLRGDARSADPLMSLAPDQSRGAPVVSAGWASVPLREPLRNMTTRS